MRCEFCRNNLGRWRYPGEGRDWQACERCHGAIQADDRETLLSRVLAAPVPRTVPDRYAARITEQARKLHDEFWSSGPGEPEPLSPGPSPSDG